MRNSHRSAINGLSSGRFCCNLQRLARQNAMCERRTKISEARAFLRRNDVWLGGEVIDVAIRCGSQFRPICWVHSTMCMSVKAFYFFQQSTFEHLSATDIVTNAASRHRLGWQIRYCTVQRVSGYL